MADESRDRSFRTRTQLSWGFVSRVSVLRAFRPVGAATADGSTACSIKILVHCFKSDVLARPRELAPSKTWLTSPATGPFGLGRNSHGVSCLLSTCDDLNAGSRRPPASPPAGFDYPLGSGCSFRPYPSVERTGALPRLSSSEVLPLTDRSLSPVSDPLAVSREHPVRGPPNERWTRHRLQGFYPGENPLAFARHRQNAGHARSLTACLRASEGR